MKQFGIDISKWQGNFDFDLAKKDGVSFAIIKGGGGDNVLYKDTMFERNYIQAKEKSLPIGCYWFSRATSVFEAEKEAEYFYSNILFGKQFELPIYIDVEHKDMLSLGKRTLTDIIKKWCSILENKGFYVGIYSTAFAFSAYMFDDELKRYTHWIAEWSSKCSYSDKNVLGIWQFGGETNLIRTNKIAGVVCDQNYMYVDFPKTIKELQLNGFSNTNTNTKSVTELAKEVIAGKWGIGSDRKKRLNDAGYDYSAVQEKVNELLNVIVTKETLKSPAEPKSLKVGDKVRLSGDAYVFGKTTKFASFVYDTTLYLRELDGNRAVISTQKTGDITGAVDVKYLTKEG